MWGVAVETDRQIDASETDVTWILNVLFIWLSELLSLWYILCFSGYQLFSISSEHKVTIQRTFLYTLCTLKSMQICVIDCTKL